MLNKKRKMLIRLLFIFILTGCSSQPKEKKTEYKSLADFVSQTEGEIEFVDMSGEGLGADERTYTYNYRSGAYDVVLKYQLGITGNITIK